MNNSEKINIRGYCFSISELLGYNPYNNEDGSPIIEFLEKSYAWCEAAYLYRTSKKIA